MTPLSIKPALPAAKRAEAKSRRLLQPPRDRSPEAILALVCIGLFLAATIVLRVLYLLKGWK